MNFQNVQHKNALLDHVLFERNDALLKILRRKCKIAGPHHIDIIVHLQYCSHY